MKTIVIIASDVVPLPIKKEYLDSLSVQERKEFKSKYTYAEPAGIRSWKFASVLAEKYEVLLLVPDIALPDKLKEIVDFSNIKFEIGSYNYRVSSWNWTQELDRKLKKANFVIVQCNSGSGIQNCSVLPSTVNLIVDGYNILPQELSGKLLTHSMISRKVFWQKAMMLYNDLITRSNCLLVANERQTFFYEGFFYGIGKLNYSTFQFSPLLKVPYGIEKKEFTETNFNISSNNLKLLWYGTVYPWECPEVLIKELADFDKISIDFINIKHTRQPKVFNTYFKSFFDNVPNISNIQIIDDIDFDLGTAHEEYDFGICLNRNWIYESYVHKTRALEMLANQLPIIINDLDNLNTELDFLKDNIRNVNIPSIKENLITICENKKSSKISKDSYETFTNIFNWNNTLLPVIDYIENF